MHALFIFYLSLSCICCWNNLSKCIIQYFLYLNSVFCDLLEFANVLYSLSISFSFVAFPCLTSHGTSSAYLSQRISFLYRWHLSKLLAPSPEIISPRKHESVCWGHRCHVEMKLTTILCRRVILMLKYFCGFRDLIEWAFKDKLHTIVLHALENIRELFQIPAI